MIFERIWLLPALLLPLGWLLWQWRRTSRRWGLLLKALAFAALLLALAGPVLPVWETKMSVAVLVDTSASVSEEDLERSSSIVADLERVRGRHALRVMPFAGGVRAPSPEELQSGSSIRYTAGPAGRATNIEAAIREALAATPAGLVPKLVVISDGKENRGSLSRAAWQARELGIPIDTYALAGRSEPELRLETVSFPSITFAGERFPIELAIHSPVRCRATATVAAEGREIGSGVVQLEPGRNDITIHGSLNLGGAYDLTGVIAAEGLGEARFAQAVTVRRPRLLYLSKDPPGTETHLLSALAAAEFDITESDLLHSELDRYQVVVLNNWNIEEIPRELKETLNEFVRNGGGLLVIGGENNVYVEDRLERDDPLEDALPAKLAPPRSPEGTCVVLIIDKSSSMEGRKMELARLSAIGVVDNLRPVDWVGVLIFDNSFQWVVPVRKAENKTLIKRLISGVTPDGGTQIAPALAEAYRRTLPVQATFKHIVLLTDGISEEGDSMALAQEAARQKVTISTVGLGQDVNKAYLEKVAMFANGKSHFLTDPSGLARILLRDVMEHTGRTTVEKAVTPVVVQEAEILAGFSSESFPELKGYVRFEAKPDADTILRFDPEDPLLVRWQYGLGRAAVFTSDAKSRWAESWVGWDGFDTFWVNLIRDLLPHSSTGEVRTSHDSTTGDLIVDYRLARQATSEPPDVFVLGPDGFRQPLALSQLADGAYRGRVSAGGRQGLFRVRPLEESDLFPETGIYLQEDELNDYGADSRALESLAAFTGGAFEPEARVVFDGQGRAVASSMPLWPGLLVLALLLNLAELVLRKWRAIFQR